MNTYMYIYIYVYIYMYIQTCIYKERWVGGQGVAVWVLNALACHAPGARDRRQTDHGAPQLTQGQRLSQSPTHATSGR